MTTEVTGSKGTPSVAPEEFKPHPHIPTTVSKLAQEYLKTAVPVGGPVKDPKVWVDIRKIFAKVTQKDSDAAKMKFIEKVEETTVANVPVTIATPKGYKKTKQDEDKVLVYMHGGAFTLGSTSHLYQIFAPISHEAGCIAYSIEYPLAPEKPFPQGLESCFAVFKEVIKKVNPKNVVLLGDSSGGNLVLGTLLKAQKEKLPMPAAVGLYSPEAEAQKKGDTYYTHEGISPKLNYELSLQPSLQVYAPNTDLSHPLISPINGEFSKKTPPIITFTGTRDLFLSTCARLDTKLSRLGIESVLKVKEGMWHGYQEMGELEESRETASELANFFKKHLKN